MPPARLSLLITIIAVALSSVSFAQTQPTVDPAKRDMSLEFVPENAVMYIMIANMDKLSQKMAAFNDEIGGNTSAMSDVLGEFKRSTGLISGVNDQGPLLLVMPKLPADQSAMQSGSFLMIMPVSNYDEFITKVGGTKGEEVTAVKLGSGFSGYSRLVSGHAVLGQSKEAIMAYTPGRDPLSLRTNAGKLGSTYLNRNDAVVVINIAQLRPMLRPKLQESIKTAITDIEEASMQRRISRAKAQESRTYLNLYASAIRPLLEDTDTVTFGMNIGADGIGMTMTASFTAGSTTAKVLSNGGNASALTNMLPNQSYVSATAIDFGQIDVKTIADAIDAQLPPIDEGGTIKLLRMALPMMRMTKGGATAYYTPPPGAGIMGSNMLSTVSVLSAEDGPSYRRALRGYINSMAGLQMPTSVTDANGNLTEAPIIFDTDYSPNTLNIDTIEVDQYSVRYQLPSEMMQTQTGSAAMLIGGSGQSGYVANRANYVVTTTSTNPQMIKSALSTIDPNVPGLGSLDSIRQARELDMTPKPFIESLLSVKGMAQTAKLFVGMMSPENQDMVPIPEDLPPIAFSASLEDSTLAGRAYVPTSVVIYAQNLIAMMSMNAQQQQPMADGPVEPNMPNQNRAEDRPWEQTNREDNPYSRTSPGRSGQSGMQVMPSVPNNMGL